MVRESFATRSWRALASVFRNPGYDNATPATQAGPVQPVVQQYRAGPLTDTSQGRVDGPTVPYDMNQIIHRTPIASRGTESYSGYTHEEYLRELLGHERAKVFDKMARSDTQISMLESAVKNPLRGAVWKIEPGGESQQDLQCAALLDHIFFKDTPRGRGWNKTLDDILSCVRHGHAVIEKTYKLTVNHPVFGTYHGIGALDHISPKTIYRWNLKPDGSLDTITQIANGDLHRYVNVPAEFLLVFTLNQEGSNYEGISMLRPCYGPWLRKNIALKINAIGIERFAIATPIVQIPAGWQSNENYPLLIAALEAFTSGESNYLTIPKGYELQLDNKNSYDPEKVDKTIDAEDRRMTKAFCANFLELGLSGSGSFALGENMSSFFLQGIEHIGKMICEVINAELIPELINLNYAPGVIKNMPRITCTGISDKAGKELAEILRFLAMAQIIEPDDALEANVRERYGLTKKSELGKRILGAGGAGSSSASGGMGGDGGGGSSGGMHSLAERIRRRIYGDV